MSPSPLAGLAHITADAARQTEVPADPDEAEDLAYAAERASADLLSLAGRIRAARHCDGFPDLDGLCSRCGSQIARPIRMDHDCMTAIPRWAARSVKRRAVRVGRMLRIAFSIVFRSPATATPRAVGGEAGGSSPEAHSYTELSAPGTHTERGE